MLVTLLAAETAEEQGLISMASIPLVTSAGTFASQDASSLHHEDPCVHQLLWL